MVGALRCMAPREISLLCISLGDMCALKVDTLIYSLKHDLLVTVVIKPCICHKSLPTKK